MPWKFLLRSALLVAAFPLTACDRKAEVAPAVPTAEVANPSEVVVPVPEAGSQFNPLLRSQALKDAIHRAMTTGENQRWQDGALSGYAVPSQEKLPNGCRTIQYTVDQRPDAPMMTINACEGSR